MLGVARGRDYSRQRDQGGLSGALSFEQELNGVRNMRCGCLEELTRERL